MQLLNRRSAHGLSKVRFIGEGSNEIIHIDEAFDRAEEFGLDLVIVSLDATPPVVRVQDFKKIEYEKKKAKKGKKGKTSTTLKEIQFKINISVHDLTTKVNKIEKFLERGDKVKISVRLKGREKENPGRAFELLDRVIGSVECVANRVPGPVALAILEPGKSPVKKPVIHKPAAQPSAPLAAAPVAPVKQEA